MKESNVTCSRDRKNYFCPKVSKIGSIIDHRIDYSEQGVLSERLVAHIQEINWPEFPPPPLTAGFSIDNYRLQVELAIHLSVPCFRDQLSGQVALHEICSVPLPLSKNLRKDFMSCWNLFV